jgi:hypothetical protein
MKLKNKTLKIYKGKVHDLTVENSHTYNVEGLGVHNSAAGCLLTWSLDITKIDPIPFKLYFERFLNPERKCITINNDVLMKDGSYKNIMDINIEEDKNNIQTQTGIGELLEIIEREIEKNEEIYRIETMDGTIAELTGNHIVPVVRDGIKVEIKVKDIKNEDYLITF